MSAVFNGSSKSRQSLAAVQEQLGEEAASNGLEVGDELLTVLDVIDGSAGLRRALTDPARQGAERAELIRSLVGPSAQQVTVSILESVVSRRWGSDRDLGDAVEALAVTVVAAHAERSGLAGLEALEEALLSFRRVIMESHGVQRALADHQAPIEAKQKLALRLSESASTEARLLIDRAVATPRGLRPAALIEQFAEIVAERQQRWIAQVIVAKPLEDSYREKLWASLNRYFGRELKLDVVVDAEYVGGIRVQVGDEVIDSTVSSRLDNLERRITR